jgi:hypothetical protein
MLDAEGMLRLPELRAAFRDGETLYLTKAHRVHRPLMNLTRAVELTLESFGVRRRAAVSAHVFLTPPGAQGLRPHRDDHGSLILQLHGSKQWDIHVDERGPDDQRTVGAVGDEALLGRHESFNLESGDVLYVPEWWVHSARASDPGSLHVTLRIFPLRWVDLLTAASGRVPALEQSLPFNPGSSADEVAATLTEVLDEPTTRHRLTTAAQDLLRRPSLPETSLPDDGLAGELAAGRLQATSWLVKASGTTCWVSLDEDSTTITFPGGSVCGPAELDPVFRHIAAASRLRPMDLPAADGDYDRTGLARELVRAGILTVEGTHSGPHHDQPQPPS